MKSFCLILLASLVLASSAFATPSPCAAGPLSLYLVPGFSCTINLLTFGSWGYSSAAFGSGIAIPATGVTVTPIGTSGDEGFQFNAPWNISAPSSAEDSLISFAAVGQGITNLELFFDGSVTGSGSTNVTENYCLGQTTLTGCPLANQGQIKVTNPPKNFNDHVFFSAQSQIAVSKDIVVSTGVDAGSAHISQVINNFSSPEPLSFVLLGSGLLGLGLLRKRIKR